MKMFSKALGVMVLTGASLMAKQEVTLKNLENYLNSSKTAEAGFEQLDPNGALSEGKFYLSRPGKLRFIYTKPKNQTIVADGQFLTHMDTSTDEVTQLALSETPAEFILKETITFSEGVSVADFYEEEKTVRVKLVRAGDPEMGSLTLVFRKDPVQLVQWIILDAQGLKTVVNLKNFTQNVRLNDELFELPKK